MIIKLQRPLGGPADAPWMAYDQKFNFHAMIAPNLIADKRCGRTMGNEAKGYFKARTLTDGRLIILERVDEQDW